MRSLKGKGRLKQCEAYHLFEEKTHAHEKKYSSGSAESTTDKTLRRRFGVTPQQLALAAQKWEAGLRPLLSRQGLEGRNDPGSLVF